tara:strand:+ start:753 stop:2504 length:1752 start_codon:yes stop_codon:yes gene_type:complete
MEVFKDLDNPASKEFEKLLNSQFTKNQNLVEGKVINCVVSKVTDKFVYLTSEGLKQEPIIDLKELQLYGLSDKAVEGATIQCLLEKLEHPKTGEIVVSVEKAVKLEGWNKIVELHKKEEPVNGRIIRKCKGGAEVALDDLKLSAFLPGSMVDETPLKNFDFLIGTPQKFAIVKLDMQRGNVVVSRKHIITSFKTADKKKLLEGYKEGDLVNGTCKQLTTFGAFFSLENGLDTLVHNSQLSYARLSHADEVVSEGDKKKLKIIGIDLEKLQLSCSLKMLQPDPFDNIDKYQVGKIYPCRITKILEFGFFAELEKNLICLVHQTEISHTKKNVSAKKLFNVNQEVSVSIKEIDKENKRIAASVKDTIENPYDAFVKNYKIGDIVDATIVAKNDYAYFASIKDFKEIEIFIHAKNISWSDDTEENLKKYGVKDNIKIKILEINTEDQKIRGGIREASGPDPILFFENKNVNDRISCKVISSDRKKGLTVQPIGTELSFLIKKSAISMNPADARPERWVGGETLDVCLAEKDLTNNKRKITLSIKLLESLEKAEALEKYGAAEGSGRSLPFSSLADSLEKKKKDSKE